MEKLYQEIILDHYRTPHHFGLRDPYDAQVHHVNPTCGDEVTLRVRLRPADSSAEGVAGRGGGVVVADISYEALGCSISQAATSVLTDLAIGRTLPEVLATLDEFTAMVTGRGTVDGDEDVLGDGIAFAGVAKYPARVKCALLGWMAFKDAVTQGVDRQETVAQAVDSQDQVAQGVNRQGVNGQDPATRGVDARATGRLGEPAGAASDDAVVTQEGSSTS